MSGKGGSDRKNVLTEDPSQVLIDSPAFIWLHLPKTGGTSFSELFRQHRLPGCTVDPDHLDSKHDSIAVRENRSGWRAGERPRFITSRRLENWLISDWQHKRRHMNLPNLDFDPVRRGLFYSLRLGGSWVAADWWLQYFEVDDTVTALRLEHLQSDLNRSLLPLLPAGTPPFGALPKKNAKPNKANHDQPHFNNEDLRCIAAVNPRWDRWQAGLYGRSIGASIQPIND